MRIDVFFFGPKNNNGNNNNDKKVPVSFFFFSKIWWLISTTGHNRYTFSKVLKMQYFLGNTYSCGCTSHTSRYRLVPGRLRQQHTWNHHQGKRTLAVDNNLAVHNRFVQLWLFIFTIITPFRFLDFTTFLWVLWIWLIIFAVREMASTMMFSTVWPFWSLQRCACTHIIFIFLFYYHW